MSSKLISVDDEEAEVLPHDQQQVPVSNNNADWASFTTTQATTTTTTTTTTTNEDPDDALSFIVLPPSTTNTTQQQQQQRVPLVTDDLRLGSGAFDDLDALFGDNNNNALKTSIAAAGAVAPTSKRTNSAASTVIDLTSVQVLSDELRRTAQLRALVLRALGELESVAQLLVDSAWSFPNETRQYSAPCGDRERTVFVASFTAAARDRARIDALRRQLRAICFAHERTHFLALCEVAHSELRLAHAVDSLDAAALSGDARRRLLDCLFQTLSEDEGVGTAASVRTASVVHELIAAVAAASARGVERIPPAYALDRLGECGGGTWGARWLFRSTAADVIAGGLVERIFADMQRTPVRVWPSQHYLSLLNRIDWRAVCLAIPQQSLHLVIEPLVGGLLSTAGRTAFANVVTLLCQVLVMFTERHTVLLARVFDALSLAPWPARGIAMPFLALMPWERADASLLRIAFARLYELPQGVTARQWSAADPSAAALRAAHRNELARRLERHPSVSQAVYERMPRVARALGFGGRDEPSPVASDGKAGDTAAAHTAAGDDDGGGDAPAQDGDTPDVPDDGGDVLRESASGVVAAAVPPAQAAVQQNQNLGLIPLLRVLGVLAEADVRLFDGQEKSPTLAVRVIDELCYFAFTHSQAGASLWIVRNESFLELARLVRAVPSLMSYVLAALTRDLPLVEVAGVVAFFDYVQPTLTRAWKPTAETIDYLGWLLAHRKMQTARTTIDQMLNLCVHGGAHAYFNADQVQRGYAIGRRVVEAIAWRDVPRRMQFDALCVLLASDAQVPPPWPAVALATPSIGGTITANMQDYWMQMVLSIPIKSAGFNIAQMQMAFSVAGAQESPSQWLAQWGLFARLDSLVQMPALDDASLTMIERLLRATISDLNAELVSRVHVWLTMVASRNALAVQQLMQRTLVHGGERWRSAWMRLLAPTPLQIGRSPLMPLLNALCYACLLDDAALAVLLRPHANTRFTPQELVSLVRNGMPWFVVALLTDAAEQAMPDGVVEGGVPAAVGDDGRPLAKSAKWFAQRARVALKLGGDAESLVNARSVALSCDGAMAWTVGVFAWDAFFRLLFGSRDAVLPPDERRSLTATFQTLADRAAQTGDEMMRRVFSNFASFSPQIIFGNAKSVLATRDGAVLRDMVARLPPVLVIGEERAADNADDRATVVSVAAGSDNVRAARPAVPVVDRSDTPPLDSASSLPAVRAGRRMRARVEALLDEARAVPLDAVDFPLLSLAERFRALADRRAAVLLFLADLDDSFVQTIERMYINVPSSRNVAVACVRGSQCRQPAQMVVLDNTAQDGGVTGELIANREQVGKQLQQLQQCARNLGAALLTLDAAIERVLDTEDVAAARALFFGMLESVVLADVVPPDSPALTAVIGSLQRLGTLLQAASQPRSDALLAEALGSLAIASSSSSSSSSSLSTRSRPILDAGEHEKRLLLALLRASAHIEAGVELPSAARDERLPFGKSRADLFALFAPLRVLPQQLGETHGWLVYTDLLRMLATRHTELGNNELLHLAARFEVSATVQRMLREPGGPPVAVLVEIGAALLRTESLAPTGVALFEQVLLFDFGRHVGPVLNLLLELAGDGQMAACAWNRVFPSEQMATLAPEVIQELAALLCERLPLPDVHVKSALLVVRALLLGTRLQQHLHVPAVWVYINKLFDACLREREREAVMSERNFERALSLLTDVTRASPTSIDCVWPLLTRRVLPRLATAAESLDAELVKWANACVELLARLPWSAATFHVVSPAAVRTTLADVRDDRMGARVLAGGLDWTAARRWLTPETDAESFSTVGASLLRYAVQLEFVDRSLVKPSLLALVEGEHALDWSRVLEATFRGELENCLLTLMVASPRDPTAAVQAGIKRLAAVAAAAPALRADCARIIRAPLFAVLESPSDAGGRRARWHLPLDVHETAVREALVPLCSSEVASGADDADDAPVHALLSCAKGRPLATHTSAAMRYSGAAEAAQEASDDMTLAGDAPLWLASRGISAPGVNSFERRLEATLAGFCASAPATVCLRVLRAGSGACKDVDELVRLYEAALHGFFAQAASGDAGDAGGAISVDDGSGRGPLHSAVATLGGMGRAVCESRLTAASNGHCALTLRVLLEWLRLRPTATWHDTAGLVRFVSSFEPSRHHVFDVLTLWFFVLDRLADARWSASEPQYHDELLVAFYRHLQRFSGVTIHTAGASLRARIDATRAKLSGELTPRMRLAAVAVHAFAARLVRSHSADVDAAAAIGGELQQALYQLEQWRQNNEFRGFDRFFNMMAQLDAPLFTLQDFQQQLSQTLVPIAPYLESTVWLRADGMALSDATSTVVASPPTLNKQPAPAAAASPSKPSSSSVQEGVLVEL